MLKVNNVRIDYAGVSALRDVSLTVCEGEIVSVIGANGGGKTTLLKAISGLLKPLSGTIEFLGERIDILPPHEICRKGLIQVPEGRQLFPKMKVIHNLEMGAYVREARKKEAESLHRVFQLFPRLDERKYQRAGLLSGGEQQMLAIGRALMSGPKLLILDEPSEGLSPLVAANIFDTLKILREQGLSILLVSQEVEQSLGLSDRGYVLENGKITLEGKNSELLNNDKVRKSYFGL